MVLPVQFTRSIQLSQTKIVQLKKGVHKSRTDSQFTMSIDTQSNRCNSTQNKVDPTLED